MKIREIELQDIQHLYRIQKQVEERFGFQMDVPKYSIVDKLTGRERINPEIASAVVFLDDDEIPRMATILRKTTEAALLIDRSDGTGQREWWSRFLCVEKASHIQAVRKGYSTGFTFLPPHIAKTWGRAIEMVGWKPQDWPVWRKRHYGE